jgi:serine/threonine-protein kinase
MGTVYAGHLRGPSHGFSRLVAIKRLHSQFARDPDFCTMFLDEARLTARIHHPNVVATLDVVEADGELFVVMEYVEGQTLAKLLRDVSSRGETIPPRVCAGIMVGVLRGLHAAHMACDEQGRPLAIVHRDVSPQNVIVGPDGVARVLDFGVAKALGRNQATTREGRIKGKIGYMAPEQLNGQTVTARADVYAASVVFWEALTSRKLFVGDSEAVVLARVIAQEIDSPQVHAPEVPDSLAQIVMRGLAAEPDARYETAEAMALAIEKCEGPVSVAEIASWIDAVAGESIRKRAEELSSDSGVEATAVTVEAPSARTSRPRGRRIVPPLVLGGALTAAAFAGVMLLHRSPVPTPPTPAAVPSASEVASHAIFVEPPTQEAASAAPTAGNAALQGSIATAAKPKRAAPRPPPAAAPRASSPFDRIGGRQ